MNSKNNQHRPKSLREYFDNPYNYQYRKCKFSPQRPQPVYHDKKEMIRQRMSHLMKTNAFESNKSMDNRKHKHSTPIISVTNGLSNIQFDNEGYSVGKTRVNNPYKNIAKIHLKVLPFKKLSLHRKSACLNQTISGLNN